MGARPRTSVVTAALLVAAASLLAPTAATAAPPRTIEGTNLTLLCDGSDADGAVELALDVSVDASGERTGGFLDVYGPDGNLSALSAEGQADVRQDGGVLSGSFPMLDAETNAPVGTASGTVTVSQDGEPTTTTQRTRTGNAWRLVTAIRQPLVGSGSVRLVSGASVDVTCSGSRSHVTERTMPEAFVQRLDGVDIGDPGPECVTAVGDGRVLVLAAEGLGRYVSVALVDETGFVAGQDEQAVTSGGEVSATVPLFSAEGEFVGDAVVALGVGSVTGRESWVLRQQYRTQTTTRDDVVMTGTVVLPDGGSVALACEGRRFLTREVATSPSGPKPGGGRAPANDTVAGAVPLRPGGKASVQTGGAAAAPEVDQWCYENDPEDPGFLPRHSVWYSFTGTGGPVTVDTAGSGFNTTLAVYGGTPGVDTEIACVDDDGPPVRTYQAYATVDTVRGAPYVVQVAGLGGEYGLLRVALR